MQHFSPNTPHKELGECELFNQKAFHIPETNQLPPFLMQLITNSDVWAYIGSNGAITAGRKNPDFSIFPYYTHDKLYDTVSSSGSFTAINLPNNSLRWTPFSSSIADTIKSTRNTSKSANGIAISLDETDSSEKLNFKETWSSSADFGLLRKAELTNLSKETLTLNVLDGIQNIIPSGVDQQFQNEFSNLANAYKRNELFDAGLATYSLSSIPTDKAEPNEGLKATTVWSAGFEQDAILLSDTQLHRFYKGDQLTTETDTRAQRGCYFLQGSITLQPGETKEWWIVADVEQSGAQISNLIHKLQSTENMSEKLEECVRETSQQVDALVSSVDGIQSTAKEKHAWRHYSNALFNMMRGGTFPQEYQIPVSDLLEQLKKCNREVYAAHKDWIRELGDFVGLEKLQRAITELKDPHLKRVINEYLPLSFSRRHGDPSRPWNRFNIDVKDEQGNAKYAYQGNWRDIFQNWEALLFSFPRYTNAVISRFLNATTVDGYNPYRVTKDGFEWEREEPDAPWSNIGYWGDHQIIYLLKLLEFSTASNPDELLSKLNSKEFAFAHVPYRIAPFEKILKDARDTIVYDYPLSDEIDKRTETIGNDGQLYHKDGEIVYSTLVEKLLLPLLSKLSNFVPEAGIWMNTQRPEWNDANNALAGYGASMVTLGYIHRYITYMLDLLEKASEEAFELEPATLEFLNDLTNTLINFGNKTTNDAERGAIVRKLGEAGTTFRENYYRGDYSAKSTIVSKQTIIEALQVFSKQTQKTLEANKREDDLYHSYNLLHFNKDGSVSIEYLSLMLEGQVSTLSSGALPAKHSNQLLNSLKRSALYREDQNSYILYPNRELPNILQKGVIDQEGLSKNDFLLKQIADGKTSIVEKAEDGTVRFKAGFKNASFLTSELEKLDLTESEKTNILDLYEATFHHHAFTGRSGTFFAYEGLGSIYWHMVSKLLLAVQEIIIDAPSDTDPSVLLELRAHYENIKAGIGTDKSPSIYGAFPTDPYSHTPAHAGAQQPGMTGQVKEDFIVRLAELGVQFKDGCITFAPTLLSKSEFESNPSNITIHKGGKTRVFDVKAGEIAFTLCQTPIIYSLSTNSQTEISINGENTRSGNSLSKAESNAIMSRSGTIDKIEVRLPKELFYQN